MKKCAYCEKDYDSSVITTVFNRVICNPCLTKLSNLSKYRIVRFLLRLKRNN